MPIALDPEQRFKIVLENDQSKPEGEQPGFIFRYASERQRRELVRCYADAFKLDDDQFMASITDGMKQVLVGWENMSGVEFQADKLVDVCTISEIMELYTRYFDTATLSELQLKKSELPSQSSLDSSAEAA